MIGIIGAMDIEVQQLRDVLVNPKVQVISGIEFTEGIMAGKDVVVAKCGVGKVFAAICAQIMMMKYPITRLINAGVAGSLSKDLHVGDLAISSGVVQHDVDTSAVGDPLGLISGINIIEFKADKGMSEKLGFLAEAMNVHSLTGVIASGDQFIHDGKKREAIAQQFNAIASEMEAGAIAQVAYINQCPFVAIRVISDEADGKATEDYGTFRLKAADISSTLAVALVNSLHE